MKISPSQPGTDESTHDLPPVAPLEDVRPLAGLRSSASHALTWAAAPLAAWRGPRSDGRFGILMYHRVVPPPANTSPPTYNVPPDRFRRQLEGLLAKGYRPVPLSEAIECHRSGKSLPPRAFVVTFDDACESVYQCALPVLETFGIPATVFVATAYLDSDAAMPFDDWPAAGWPGVSPVTWRTMTTEQCLDAQQGGLIELACHTHTHADFRGRPEAFAEDLSLSLKVLQERFGVRIPALAFPGGANEPAMLAVAKRLGLTCSLTTLSQRADLRADPHGWGRFTAELFDTAATLSTKVSGWYDLLRGRGGRHGSTMTGLGESSTDVERAGGQV